MDSREKWEQELRDRQRNIVFPDTVRNEGWFYRALTKRDVQLSTVQRVGCLIIALPTFCFGIAAIAAAVGHLGETVSLESVAAAVFLIPLGAVFLAFFVRLALAAIVSPVEKAH